MKKPMPFGKYFLLDRINVGGMAEVFKAKTEGVEGFERHVAVKRILPSIAEDEEFIKMFIDEAKIAVQLTHPNIAQIIDLGKVADAYFIAMEYIHGRDLRAIYDRGKKRGEVLPVPMTCYVMMKMCEGLDYAHNKRDASGSSLNLVHRDVSPQNILCSFDGEVKIIDFGIAKAANKAAKTQAGILKGKFGYMSPEQVRGLPLDHRSDIFSCGIILYELLTGERLFVGESDFSTLEKVRNVEIMPPSTYNRSIPEELERIVLKALAKEKEDRYQTAIDLHDDLQSFMYTTEKFFAQKDLAAFLRKTFPEDLRGEHEGAEAEAAAPPSGPSRLPPPRKSGMMPPPRAPVPPPRASLPSPRRSVPPPPPKRTLMGMPAVAPPEVAAQAQAAAAPVQPPAPPPMPAAAAPMMMQGVSQVPALSQQPQMPAVPPRPPVSAAPPMPQLSVVPPMPQVPAPPPPAPPPIIMPSLPPPTPEVPAAPPAPPPPAPTPPGSAPPPAAAASAPPSSETLEWDDDEMATQIYEKQMLLEASRGLRIDTSSLSTTGAPVPSRTRPAAEVDREAPPRRSSTGLIVGAILGVAVVIAVAIVLLGRGRTQPSGLDAAADVPLVATADAGGGQVVAPVTPDSGPVEAPQVQDAAAPPPPATRTVVIGLGEELRAAVVKVDSSPVEWTAFLKVDVQADGGPGAARLLEIEWPGRQCKEPKPGGCPAWRIDASTGDFRIGADSFAPAPVRVALQGTLIEGASLFREVKPEGSASAAYENLAIQVEGQSSYVTLMAGSHAIVVRKEGFPDFPLPPFEVPENPAAAQPLRIPLLVTLEVRSDPDHARVLLALGNGDPEQIGVTGDDPVRRLVDRSQSYKVRILKGGYKPFEDSLTFAEGSSRLALAPHLDRDQNRPPPPPPGPTGRLTVVTQPWTMVYVGGRRIKQTPLLNHELAEGRYQITLLNQEAGIRHTETVIIQAGRTTMIRRTQDQLR